MSEQEYFDLTHMSDALMTAQEVKELPKAWGVGGDGGIGDIGFQNTSKVVLQNRPNVQLLMLDTQVYSNTGGQNSDSSPMPGGFDMNQFGAGSQGKLTEKKGLAECFISGHGSPYVAQVSMANAAKLFKAVIDGLDYRGTAFLQCYSPCQPEHGIADSMATIQASRARDCRALPELVFNPKAGESYQLALDLKGNPTINRDWAEVKYKSTGERYRYTVAHWAATEARFRRHFKPVKDDKGLLTLEDMLVRITQDDVTQRHVFDPKHRSYIPDFGVYIDAEDDSGKIRKLVMSRQMVLFCVERRRAWRMLQSKVGIENPDYTAQRAVLERLEKEKVDSADLHRRAAELLTEELERFLSAGKETVKTG
jgi:pyruvate-ferredoxin/flavodoxin oxidoreductase